MRGQTNPKPRRRHSLATMDSSYTAMHAAWYFAESIVCETLVAGLFDKTDR